jgi:two-component system, OmpR family, response regulator
VRILLIEDDAKTAQYVRTGLSEAGHVVDVVADGREGVSQAMGQEYDVLILDRMLPFLDGLSIAKTVRAAQTGTPILFLTALGSINERVEGLDIGDDYLVKPFAFSELLARVNALGRRPALKDRSELLQVADLVLDSNTRLVTRAGVRLDLQQKEFALLEFFMLNKGRVVTRTMLLERVWDLHFDPKTSVVETHISRLRAKIDRPFAKPLLQTVRGTGYMLSDAS